MKNFAEEITYWYFRFNGFFTLNNYVTHPMDRGDESHSDTDILALRIGTPFEEIGINFHSEIPGIAPCPVLEMIIQPEHDLPRPELVGIICEVKAGLNYRLKPENLRAQLLRFGFITNQDEANERISNTASYTQDGNTKIVRIIANINGNNEVGFYGLSLSRMLFYIKRRFEILNVQKQGGWNMFDSPLIQYLLKENFINQNG